MLIQGHEFEVNYLLKGTTFNEVAEVYLVYTTQSWLDVGETDKLATRLSSHERKPDWYKNANGEVIYIAFYPEVDELKRRSVEAYLRNQLNPVCGYQ